MTEKKKIIFIAGCSHAAGSEIDGTEDSFYNRQNSFPTHLANHMGRLHVHAALPGATNPTIARALQEWFLEKYDKETMDVFVLIAWTDASRIELPSETPKFHNVNNLSADWFSKTSIEYHRLTATGLQGTIAEQDYIDLCQKFMVMNPSYLEIYTANLILQTQYFLNMHNIKYLMCSTNTLFMTRSHINWYKHLIDKTRFINFDNFNESFYPKYINLGYENKLAKYFHHGAEPHLLYAEYLYDYIKKYRLDHE
jgi:hypothetical protein